MKHLFSLVSSPQIRGAGVQHVEPNSKSNQATTSGSCILSSAIQGTHALVVEDNEINQFVITLILKEYGVRVTVAENGKEAIRMLQDQTFDIVLMDMEMPVMGGIEATRCIRQDERFRHLPILATTASDSEEAREACLSAGMNDYALKPVLPDVLLEMLIKHIKPRALDHKSDCSE